MVKIMTLLTHFPWTFSNIYLKSNISANNSVAEIIHCNRDTRIAHGVPGHDLWFFIPSIC